MESNHFTSLQMNLWTFYPLPFPNQILVFVDGMVVRWAKGSSRKAVRRCTPLVFQFVFFVFFLLNSESLLCTRLPMIRNASGLPSSFLPSLFRLAMFSTLIRLPVKMLVIFFFLLRFSPLSFFKRCGDHEVLPSGGISPFLADKPFSFLP